MRLTVNGAPAQITPTAPTAVDAIRTGLGLTGTKLVCGTGTCGACVVMVDGIPVASCLLPVEDLDGRTLTTVEGVAADRLHPVQRAFIAHDALQCGFCTPGFVVEAVAFYDSWRAERGTERPTRDDVARALAGHLCRCGAYEGIHRAVAAACAGEHDGPDDPTPARVEAVAKVTGAARFTVDVVADGMLHGRVLRSTEAHAEVLDIDPSPALGEPGVRGFVGLMGDDHRVRYVGQPIGAIAADDPDTARRAMGLVEVTYRALEPAIGIDVALSNDAPDLHGGGWGPPSSNEAPPLPNLRRGNLRGPVSAGSVHRYRARGRLARARDRRDPLLVAGTFGTQAQAHTALEPHACVAAWEDGDRVTVHLSTQGVSQARRTLAKRFDLDPEQVTVIADHVGGAFGAKQGITEEALAAVGLARATGARVRVVYDRSEELEVGGYRPGARLDLDLLGAADGSLEALSLVSHADSGAAAGQLIASLARLIYVGAPRSLLDYDVVTNAPPGKPFRAPGGPPLAWALEQGIDELAARLGESAVRLRRRWDPPPLRERLYDWVESLPSWQRREAVTSGGMRVGIGASFSTWFYGFDAGTRVTVSTRPGGLEVACATQDMGNGTRSVLAGAVAGLFGIGPGLVEVSVGDSRLDWGPRSSGSRTTASLWPAARAAATELQELLVSEAGRRLGLEGAEIVPGGMAHAGEHLSWMDVIERLPYLSVTTGRPRDGRSFLPFSIDHLRFGWGLTEAAHVVEVTVDTRMGRIRPRRVWVAVAAGRIHLPTLARSQVEGAVVQGLGYSLHEERLADLHLGYAVTTDLDSYKVPGIGDTPEIEVTFIEEGFEHVPEGGAGLSELATMGVAAAVGNAVAHATGWRPRHLPITPARLVEALA